MSTLTEQLERGAIPARSFVQALGVSSQTLMRRLRAEGDKVVCIGRGRATRYGLRRTIAGLGSSDLPLFRIDDAGKPHPMGRLVVLAGNETAWLPAGVVFAGLPPEVADMQPSGFMGRAFPRQNSDLPVPSRITDWSDDHTLIGLSRRGEDFPGNLILGDESMERWFSHPPEPVTRENFPALAEAAIAGEPAGSWAGGERPKFGAFVNGCHVLVKFAVGGDRQGERWQDLLRLEALALEVLRNADVAAAQATLVETATHRFLEIDRFDRIGPRGRRAMVSLAAAHQDPRDTWARAAHRMAEARLLTRADAERLQLYEAFARLIANEDRHHHNIALFPEFSGEGETMTAEPEYYDLAPAFDQLPMLYAPRSDGQLLDPTLVRPVPTADTWNVWPEARALAATFWRRATEDGAVSASMREIAARNLEAIAE